MNRKKNVLKGCVFITGRLLPCSKINYFLTGSELTQKSSRAQKVLLIQEQKYRTGRKNFKNCVLETKLDKCEEGECRK